MEQVSFKDSTIYNYLNENFISIRINTDHQKAFAIKWKVKGLPSLWFLEPDSTKISNVPGYVDKKQFLSILNYIHTNSYGKISFQEFLKQQ
ncbi:MAG: thioredoxin fold domain-containing protein [Pseudomonadota bacterium]